MHHAGVNGLTPPYNSDLSVALFDQIARVTL